MDAAPAFLTPESVASDPGRENDFGGHDALPPPVVPRDAAPASPPAVPKPMDLELYLTPKTYQSRFVDMSALSEESLLRVAEMNRMRRESTMAELEMWEQNAKLRDEADNFLSQAILHHDEEEAAGRLVIVKAEEKAMDRIARLVDESHAWVRDESDKASRIQKLEHHRQQQVAKVEGELHRAKFKAFWREKEEKKRQAELAQQGQRRRAEDVNKVTHILRDAYQYSAPPFSTDPEELWRRGVTVAPDLQRPIVCEDLQSPIGGPRTTLPCYNELAERIRRGYTAKVMQEGIGSASATVVAASPPRQTRPSSAANNVAQFASSPYTSYARQQLFSSPR